MFVLFLRLVYSSSTSSRGSIFQPLYLAKFLVYFLRGLMVPWCLEILAVPPTGHKSGFLRGLFLIGSGGKALGDRESVVIRLINVNREIS